MAIIKKKIENLKPGKEYVLTVRAKNSDLNVLSDYSDSIRFQVPNDATTPSALSNLQLFSGLENVMFVFDYSEDLDVSRYEYELYQNSDMSDETGPLTGFADANVFTVRVSNLHPQEGYEDDGLLPFWGRARTIDTTGNAGPWTSIVETDPHTPLIDNQYIGSLTVSKLTAGTIGSHTINLNGINSIIQSTTYLDTSGAQGWQIRGDGHFSLGGPNGITYDNDSITIGSDVSVTATLAADSIIVGTVPNQLKINGAINSGAGGMTLGDPTNNYWYSNGRFRVGSASKYMQWNGTDLSVTGTINATAGYFSGDITIGSSPGSTTLNAIEASSIDFNSRNNRNSTTPTNPTINSDGTAIDHVINGNGSADISFEWNYTYTDAQNAANNIDGFVVYVYSSDSSTPYTFGDNISFESTYPVDSDRRAIVLSGVSANKYYTFGIKAYRVVDRDISASEILYSSIVQPTRTEEKPYRPSSTIAFTGDITGTINGTAAATVVAYATAGNTVATNFNNNNDRNGTTPPIPTIPTNGTAIDHVLNTDGSVDVTFLWNEYSASNGVNDSRNIDGFIVYVRSSTSATSYTFGTTPAQETTYYLPRDKKVFILPGVAADRYYNFGIRAYRMVDTDIISEGIVYSLIAQSTGAGENPYRPESNVAFNGNITGFINGIAAATVIEYANAGNAVATNFNANNDRNNTTPTAPTLPSSIAASLIKAGSTYTILNTTGTTQAQWNTTAGTTGVTYSVGSTFTAVAVGVGTGTVSGETVDHVLNTDGSVDISFEWIYTTSDVYNVANNIDGFIVYVRSSTNTSAYSLGAEPSEETTYYLPRDKRAFILPAVAADRHYTFGVRAYRMVDTDINSAGIIYSSIVKSTVTGENPYQPSSTVAFAGNITGTVGGTSVATLISYATAGNTVATNFNTNNDRNSITPTSPTIASDTTAIDHTINTDGSADITFEWIYTSSDTYNAANNIDGFIVYVRPSTSSSTYTFGTTPAEETTYFVPREKRVLILPAVASNIYYTFGVRAYRMVDTDIASAGIIYSSIVKSSVVLENPYRPQENIAFAGDITGTVNGTAVATLVSYANAGNTAASNFNTNNDRNNITPTSPVIVSNGTAIDHTINTDGSADISFEWTYTVSDVYNAANNIDGFIVYVRSTAISGATPSSYTFGASPDQETTYYLPREKRAFILPGVAANRNYNFAVRAYRMVDTDIAAAGIIYSSIIQSSYGGELFYQPSTTVAFGGNITGTIDGTLASTIVSYANAGNTVATNFNANNDRNSITPTSPVIVSDGTAIDHVINTDGSADISFEWTYTHVDTYNVAANIDGFIVYVRSTPISGATPSSYTFGSSPSEETTYYLPREKRAFILPGVAANRNYNFAVRAYRMVDTDVVSAGIVYSPIIQSTYGGEPFYQPSTSVNYTGNISGTLSTTLVSYADAGNTVATNFNTNNDSNGLTPTSPTLPSSIVATSIKVGSTYSILNTTGTTQLQWNTTAGTTGVTYGAGSTFTAVAAGAGTGTVSGETIDHTINTDGSVDISFEWLYTHSDTYSDANNIDGFIVYFRSSTSASAYTIGTTPDQETTYYLPREKRALILPGVAANRYYTLGVRAYRMVNSNVATAGIVYSSIVQSSVTGENPYQPSTTVAFAGNITGTIDGTLASTIVSYANAGNTAATNFNTNNDNNGTTPTSPGIPSGGTAIDHTINTDGSADISFEWTYTPSDTYDAANNIDGFIVYVRSTTIVGATPSSFTFGAVGNDLSQETTYYLPREKKAFVLPAVAADRYYNFGVRAYRMVNSNVAAAGIVYSPIIQPSYGGELFYQPSSTVAFAGNITGTVNSVGVTTITTTVSNFNNNNDQKSTTPATPTSVAFSTATSNTNASIDLPLNWTFTGSGDAYDIDGFIVFLRTATATDASNITTENLNTNIQQVFLTAEKRSHTFSGISPSSFYRAAVRAYRVVDTNINSAGIIYGPLANTTERSSAIAIIGGSSGIKIGDGKIYIGTNPGEFNNSNTGFYVDSISQFSLGNKLKWGDLTNAGSFIVGKFYSIVSLGNTTQAQWNTAAGTTGATYAIGSTFTAATAGAGSGTASLQQLTIAGDVLIGSTPGSTIASGAASGSTSLQPGGAASDVNSNTTTISGGKIRTGSIQSTGYTYSSGNFSTVGMQINLDNGVIRSKNFGIDSSGNAFFTGTITASAGSIAGWTIGSDALYVGLNSLSGTSYINTSGAAWFSAGVIAPSFSGYGAPSTTGGATNINTTTVIVDAVSQTRGYLRNISYGSTKPSSAVLGDIHFS
jgi:hypothetical protein